MNYIYCIQCFDGVTAERLVYTMYIIADNAEEAIFQAREQVNHKPYVFHIEYANKINNEA